MPRPKPLYIRLYTDPPLTAIVRLLGYRELPVDRVKELLRPLAEEFGKDTMLAATREVVAVDTARVPPVARLTATARRLAWQLLGPPPAAAADAHAVSRPGA